MYKRRGPTEKELAFIEEYTENGGDREQAAIKAGYSEKSAYVIGCQLKKKLAAEIDARLTEKMGQDCVLARSVIVKLAREANSEETRLKAAKDIMDRGGHPASKEVITAKKDMDQNQNLERLKEISPEAYAILAPRYELADTEDTKH